MGICAQTMTPMEKECVLSFDEMYIDPKYEYDEGKDRVLGPHSRMQVIMAKSLFGSWKQAIFTDFDFDMDQKTINTAAVLLSQKGYNVTAIVSDCGGPNRGLWKKLGVSTSNTSFPHPITEEPIYVFADVPHLIKLFRNWLLKPGGITLKERVKITRRPLEKLLSATRTEVNSMYKLTHSHLNLSSTEKQNVRLSVQLLSSAVVQGLKDYVGYDGIQIMICEQKPVILVKRSPQRTTGSMC